jgi:hypothetical protein
MALDIMALTRWSQAQVKSQLGREVCLQYRGLRTVRCAEPHAQAPRGALVPMSEEADHE